MDTPNLHIVTCVVLLILQFIFPPSRNVSQNASDKWTDEPQSAVPSITDGSRSGRGAKLPSHATHAFS